LKKILIEPHVQNFTEKNSFQAKQSSACVFQPKFKGKFPLLNLHLSDRFVLGPEAETAFTFEGL
jgi:hypothetical protein